MSKRPTNVSTSRDLLDQALTVLIRPRPREQWLAENRDAIAAYNAHVDEAGIFGDGLRSF